MLTVVWPKGTEHVEIKSPSGQQEALNVISDLIGRHTILNWHLRILEYFTLQRLANSK